MNTLPAPKNRVRGPIKLKLRDSSTFELATMATTEFFPGSPQVLSIGSQPDNCASACQFFGGVGPLTDREEALACRQYHATKTSPTPFSVNRTSGGYGCMWGQGAPNPNWPGYLLPSFAGPANRVAKVARRVCFCNANSRAFEARPNEDFVPRVIPDL